MEPQAVHQIDSPSVARRRRPLRALALLAATLALLPLIAVVGAMTASAATGSAPVGSVDALGLTFTSGPKVVASGWTIDYDAPTKATSVALKVDGKFVTTARAALPRLDVAAAFSGVGSAHGYQLSRSLTPGTHRVCVVAVNVVNTGGANQTLACRSVSVLGAAGWIDSATQSGATMQVAGWAIDGATSASIKVRVSNGTGSVDVVANGDRPDVGAAFPGYGSAHGYTATIGTDGSPTCIDVLSAAGAPIGRLGCRGDWRDQMLQQVNSIRSYLGVGPVGRCASLDRAAQGYADQMAYLNRFTHTGYDGSQPWDRMVAAGYRWRTAGENIALGQPDIDSVMNAWVNSSGHFANLINGNFTDVGFGSTPGTQGIYWVQDFGAGGSCA